MKYSNRQKLFIFLTLLWMAVIFWASLFAGPLQENKEKDISDGMTPSSRTP